MKTKLRTVYLVRQDARAFAQDTTPTVSIDVLRDGVIVYGVKAVGKTLREARAQAEREFRALRNFVTAVKTAELAEQMGHSVKAVREAKA